MCFYLQLKFTGILKWRHWEVDIRANAQFWMSLMAYRKLLLVYILIRVSNITKKKRRSIMVIGKYFFPKLTRNTMRIWTNMHVYRRITGLPFQRFYRILKMARVIDQQFSWEFQCKYRGVSFSLSILLLFKFYF